MTPSRTNRQRVTHQPFFTGRTVAILAAVLLLLPVSVSLSNQPRIDSVPEEALLLLYIDIDKEDPGQKWVLDALTSYLVDKAGGSDDHGRLKEVDLFNFSDLSFSVLNNNGQRGLRLLMTAGLKPSSGQFKVGYGEHQFHLNIDDKKSATRFQKEILIFALSLACDIPASDPEKGGIFSNPAKEESGDFSAFYVGGKRAVLASDKKTVKRALKKDNGLGKKKEFLNAMKPLGDNWDACGYADNSGPELAGYLEKEEQGWGTLMLTLLKDVDRLGFAIEVYGRDRSKLKLSLIPGEKGNAGQLRKRLEPLLPLLVKKYLSDRMEGKFEYREPDGALVITAVLSGTAPFWEETFNIKPGEGAAKRKSQETAPDPNRKSTPSIPAR